MKKISLLTLLCTLVFVGCDSDDDSIQEIIDSEKVEIPFSGFWEREFEAGPGNLQTVLYSIYQDSIRYSLNGPVAQVNYAIKRDTFLLENNRFIGHTDTNQYYLLFTKDITENSITIYKQLISDINEGLDIGVPNEDTTENYGWNTFEKQ